MINQKNNYLLKKGVIFINVLLRLKLRVIILWFAEGAQIRTKVSKSRDLKKNQNIKISRVKDKKLLSLYPYEIFEKLKKKDILNIGFNNLLIKIK